LSLLDDRIGDIYLDSGALAARVQELGEEIADAYDGREPILVGSLKACVPFVTDLSRAISIPHALDFLELAGYAGAEPGGHERIRFLKDLDQRIGDRHVILVDEVVDTGLTMHYLCKTLALRGPPSAPRELGEAKLSGCSPEKNCPRVFVPSTKPCIGRGSACSRSSGRRSSPASPTSIPATSRRTSPAARSSATRSSG
jgi:hypoxanthine phosphoribosyltransferase